jgi:hypothetical protein
MNPLKISLFLIVTASGTLTAQDYTSVCREQMNSLSQLAGQWHGNATITQPGGVVVHVAQEETIEYKLDSLLLQVEGVGRNKTDLSSISFHALALINYNASKKNYEMKSYLKDGKQTDAFFRIVEQNRYDWGFDVPGGKVIYHIVIDPVKRTWMEKGEFSRDGTTWYLFFEMNLTRK